MKPAVPMESMGPMRLRSWRRRLAAALAAGLLALPGLGVQAASTGPSCLTLTASLAGAPTTVDLREPVTLTYTLTPGGSYTQTVARPPVNLALVTDKSGSMDYTDASGRNAQTRMQILQGAATSLINSLKGLKDAGNKPYRDKVGIVKFDDRATALAFDDDGKSSTPKVNLLDVSGSVGSTTNASQLTGQITALASGGNTNIEAALRKALSVLQGLPNAYVVLVTDGYANRYRDDGSGTSEATARSLAEAAADQLAAAGIKTYTIALGKTGGDQVDHNLLVDIAAKTRGVKYDASNLTELNNVFTQIQQQITVPSSLTGIAIAQPLPPGFALADDSDPHVHVDGNGNLIINVDPIPYPYAVSTVTASAKVKQTGAGGAYKFARGEVAYTNACGANDRSPINELAVTVLNTPVVTDKYGNVYEANRNQGVTRYRLGDFNRPQWTLPLPAVFAGYAISNFNAATLFGGDPGGHAKVHLEYEKKGQGGLASSKAAADIDLTPTAPSTLAVKDANGSVIAPSSTAWSKGPATVGVSGSASRLGAVALTIDGSGKGAVAVAQSTLPDGTANPDFYANYLYGYQISTTSPTGGWVDGTAVPGSGAFTVYARGTTAAVSGSAAALVGGPAKSQAVKLDSAPPPDPAVKAEFIPGSLKIYKYTVSSMTDADSGLQSKALTKNGATISGSLSDPYAFNAAEADIAAGAYHVVLTDKVGFRNDYTIAELPRDDTPPVLPEGEGAFKSGAYETDPTLSFAVSEPESYIYSTTVAFDGGSARALTPAATDNHTASYAFPLSRYIADAKARIGWHKMTVASTNVKGGVSVRDYAFVVDPGPNIQVVPVKAGADYSASYSPAPVALRIVAPEIVPARTMTINGKTATYPAIKVNKLYYALGDGGSTGTPAAGRFVGLGATQFTIKAEGDWRVFIRATDDYTAGAAYVTPAAEARRVKIKYDQRRY